MSLLISDNYAQLNRELHAREASYGTSGAKWANLAQKIATDYEAKTILDYGSGKGAFKSFWESRGPTTTEIIEYDPAIEGKETKPERVDMVVCGDVMEHVEPACLYAVLDDIAKTARRVTFFVIATCPAKKTLSDGRNAHLIVEPSSWWLPKLMDRWTIRYFQDAGTTFWCVGQSR